MQSGQPAASRRRGVFGRGASPSRGGGFSSSRPVTMTDVRRLFAVTATLGAVAVAEAVVHASDGSPTGVAAVLALMAVAPLALAGLWLFELHRFSIL